MRQTIRKKQSIRKPIALMLVLIILASCFSTVTPLAAPEPNYEQDFEPGYVLVGLNDPYLGLSLAELLPGLGFVEAYELRGAGPVPISKDNASRTGSHYRIKLLQDTKEGVIEAIKLLRQNPNVYVANPYFIAPNAKVEKDFLPGFVLVGFREPYHGSFSKGEFPGLEVVEAIDYKRSAYESWIAEPDAGQFDQGALDYLKSKIGIDYQIKLAKETKVGVWEAIDILSGAIRVRFATQHKQVYF